MKRVLRHKGRVAALVALVVAVVAFGAAAQATRGSSDGSGFTAVADYKHDRSAPLRMLARTALSGRGGEQAEGNLNPRIPHKNADAADPVVQNTPAAPNMPSPIMNFDGIPYPGVACNCAPPDTNGEVGATQYVQIVNEGFQVFNKFTGASVFGPVGISTLWQGFGGLCEFNGFGDPVVLYDQLADRWFISQFAGVSNITDQCIAVSTSGDAAGSYNRYGFHMTNNFYDYPHFGVWPDAYYGAANIFNASGTAFLGPQAFAWDRAKMLAGQPATFVTPGITGGANEETFLPSDLDGLTTPPANAPNTFVEWPGGTSNNNYKIWHFHADFVTPGNSTFTQFATVPAAAFTALCPTTRSCVPQANTTARLDAIADRLMFRLAYRNFGDHESVVGNFTVSSAGVAGIRWFELRNVTNGPVTKFQESTYQPDTTWRWMGSAAMDASGNIAVGFSASSASIVPGIRYAGRLAGDPLNTLGQGEATLFAGVGSQTGTSSRWGDYSDLTVDPVDDCTFWYTQEYYPSGVTSFNWRTRIGSFKFPQCTASGGTLQGTVTDSATNQGIPGASVQVVSGPGTTTNATGGYSMTVAPGTYSVTFSKVGYATRTVNNVVINDGQTTTLNVALDPAPSVTITKTADAASVASGSQIGYTVKLTNAGSVAATGLSVTDSLPSGTGINWTIGSGTDSGWSISGSPPNQSLVYSPTTLAGNASTQAHVVSSTANNTSGTFNNTASFSTANDGSGEASASISVTAPACDVSQGFNDISTLFPPWFQQNNSNPLGTTNWFQGNTAVFPAQAGPASSYIAANYQNGSGLATISNWLLTPTLKLANNAKLTFWTRTVGNPTFPDRMQVRLSQNGASTNVGSTATSVGDFTSLLLDINPTYTTRGYPRSWKQYTVTLSGIPTRGTTGRLAFRYFVEGGGPSGARSDYIGIDTMSYGCRG